MTNARFWFISAVWLFLSLSCVGEVGPQGPTGMAGGVAPGTSPDCPDGYSRDAVQLNIIICRQGMDEVVKVGKKGSAFWIDRYEATIWDNEDGSGKQYGLSYGDFPPSFPPNGQIAVPLYALSKPGVRPSGYLSWFQANEACRASGKKLPTADEWLLAARGTLDPGASDGSGGACINQSAGPRNTASGTKCMSDWGAQDMIGNVWEWTNEWYATINTDHLRTPAWPTSYGGDGTYNIGGNALVNSGSGDNLPVAAVRGGSYTQGLLSGIYALDLDSNPSINNIVDFGVRCVIPR